MALFRVTQEFPLVGDPPTQATTDRVRQRLDDAAPGTGAAVDVGIGRMQVEMTFEAESEERAVRMAKMTSDRALGSGPARVDVQRAT
ncbi:hypothetical protein OM076_04745 [Solirubrobacter ginsenosidimutans]|uniref:Uncharacterized protein n=1 Tax=Solirubrobacter ginsenosidimutans TaxID=490573 RepID=A0A9X3MTS3_9ACTN|nr:hypothetical protein [Solirubrobacter ginsenosidimutans]MDA0159563.1 hypothetical protein [Solirubrobacter ginsenosidimutans]